MTRPRLIAQNLNSSDPAVAAAIAGGDAAWIRGVARRIAATGVDMIDLNAGAMGAQEGALLRWLAEQVEPMVDLPLALDSADPGVLERVGRGLKRPALLNSLPLDAAWTEGLAALLVDRGCEVVLSLRRRRALPADANQRWAWASEGLARLEAKGVPLERVFVDAIALPWGEDFAAGRGMLDFVERWAREGRGARTLVGLGNLGHGRPDAPRINREWWARLRNAGIGAALLDAFDPELVAVDHGPGPI